MPPIIEIQDLGKRYRIGAAHEPYLSLRDSLTRKVREGVSRLLRNSTDDVKRAGEDFWALRDVSFAVEPGECVGIIGRNGAGKSTLLKILSQITPPTEGRITCRGRVASLLEVGTGFHPELTGRENIFLNGTILGMTRTEIRRKFDEIVAFAETEKFLDTPVKRYSSGMYVRLAFAVAAHLEPEVLVVDEVLAVGDAQFQKKCLGKMGEVARAGRTLFFVSHNMTAIQSLCVRTVHLRDGRVVFDGSTTKGISDYLAPTKIESNPISDQQSGGDIVVTDAYIMDQTGSRMDSVLCGDTFDVCLAFQIRNPKRDYQFALDIHNAFGLRVAYCNSYFTTGELWRNLPPQGIVRCTFRRFSLMPGQYQVGVAINTTDGVEVCLDSAISLTVNEGDFFGSGRIPLGSNPPVVLLDHAWRKESV